MTAGLDLAAKPPRTASQKVDSALRHRLRTPLAGRAAPSRPNLVPPPKAAPRTPPALQRLVAPMHHRLRVRPAARLRPTPTLPLAARLTPPAQRRRALEGTHTPPRSQPVAQGEAPRSFWLALEAQ